MENLKDDVITGAQAIASETELKVRTVYVLAERGELPVVPTEAMTQDKFLVGSFQSQTLYDRWEARVETGYVNDDFTKNLVTVLAEERIGFAAKRPEALIYGDLGFI